MMFWGLILKGNKRYSQDVSKPFHLSQACLDTTTSKDEDVQVFLTSETQNYLLCTLRKGKTNQCSLDLNFTIGDQISFLSKGEGVVHLTGYLVPDMDDDLMESDEDFDEEMSKKIMEAAKKQQGKAAAAVAATGKKGAQPQAARAGGGDAKDDDDDDEDDDDFTLPNDFDDASGDSDGEENEENSDDDDEDEDDEDDDDDSEEEPVVEEPKPKKMKHNGVENGKAQSKEPKKKETPVADKKQATKQVLQGGVTIEDIRPGAGAEAKPGKKVQVHYEGRLQSNNKMFDSNKNGQGFKFMLGRGEVIKGWDTGIAGMKVGGKRRLTIPPAMGYGQKGSMPTIPPNSTLVFEVEMKKIM